MQHLIDSKLAKVNKCIILYKEHIDKESHHWNPEELILSNQILGTLGFFIIMLNSYNKLVNDTLFMEIDALCKSIEDNC